MLAVCAAALALAAAAQLLPPRRTLEGERAAMQEVARFFADTFTSTTSTTSTTHCHYHGWRAPEIDYTCRRFPC